MQVISRIAVVLLLTGGVAVAQTDRPAPGSAGAAQSKETALQAVRQALESGAKDISQVLTDPANEPIREDREFRNLIRRHGKSAKATLAPTNEPGEPLLVTGTIRGDDGRPIEGARIYVFHTNAQGSYSSSGGNATMGDSLNPRLFAYLRTGADGRYEYRTIRPGPYPNNGPPAHVHYEILAEGHSQLVTELMFKGDSRLTPEAQAEFTRAGFVIAEVQRGQDGVQRCACDLVLRRR